MPCHVTYGESQKILNVEKSALPAAISDTFLVSDIEMQNLHFKIWDNEWNDWPDIDIDKIPEKCKLKISKATNAQIMQSCTGPVLEAFDMLNAHEDKNPDHCNHDAQTQSSYSGCTPTCNSSANLVEDQWLQNDLMFVTQEYGQCLPLESQPSCSTSHR